MGWSEEFLGYLAKGGAPMFAIDFISPNLMSEDVPLHETRYVLHSHAPASSTRINHLQNAIVDVQQSGQQVKIRSWTSSLGGLRVQLAGADVAQFIGRNIPRGLIAELKVGFQGFSYDSFETVGLYLFKNVSGMFNTWHMEFQDAFAALQQAGNTNLSAQFMEEAGTEDQLVALYDPADTSILTGSALDGSINKDTATGGRGLVKITPDTGDPAFFLKYDGGSAGTLDVIVQNVIDTVRVTAGVGSTVKQYAYVFETVPRVAQKILFGGISGSSTMPANWHMGLNYSSHLVNRTDFNNWLASYEALYTEFHGDFLTDQPLENPFRGLEEYLAAFGSWMVWKENGISWRFVQDLHSLSVPKIDPYILGESDIVEELAYNVFSNDAPIEYFQVQLPGPTTINETIRTKPAAFRHDHASLTRVYDDDVETANQSNAYNNLKNRISPWYHRICDEMQLTLATWKYASMVPGDTVQITSSTIRDMINKSIYGATGSAISSRYHDGTTYLVTGVDVDWSGFTTTLTLSTFPKAEDRY